ncbi:uncharacterized protein LOC112171393, partial [Rosa chinensis]|uniref:uncharacterized protein LOC112171393 n=1 Tax=Rosa chinensis TaxID=74649 RepID=UPI001AD93A60
RNISSSSSLSSSTFLSPPKLPTRTPSPAHTELTRYGFPIGLLPSPVKNYTVNPLIADFVIDLGDACKITLPPDNYLATYSKKVSGKINQGRIAEINDINVQAFCQWWSVTGIRSSGENLVFKVGMVMARYPSKNFNDSPACEGRRKSP